MGSIIAFRQTHRLTGAAPIRPATDALLALLAMEASDLPIFTQAAQPLDRLAPRDDEGHAARAR